MSLEDLRHQFERGADDRPVTITMTRDQAGYLILQLERTLLDLDALPADVKAPWEALLATVQEARG